MIISDAIRAAVFALIAWVEVPVVAVLILMFLAGCAAPPFGLARSAIIKEILPVTYGRGNVWVGGIQQLMQITGLALGGILLQWVDPRSALLISVVGFVLSFLLLLLLSTGRLSIRTQGMKKAVFLAVSTIRNDAMLLRAATLPIIGTAAGYAAEALVVAYAAEQLGGAWVWLLAVLVPVVTLMGMSFVGRLIGPGSSLQMLRLFPWILLLGNGIALCGAFLGLPRLLAGVMVYAGLGVVFAPFPISQTVVQDRAPREMMASIFGVLQSALFIGVVVAMGLGVVLSSAMSVQHAIGSVAAGSAAYALYAILRQPTER